LPQYQISVDKARYAEMQIIGKSLAQALEVYYMTNGKYPDYWAELDTGVEGCKESGGKKLDLMCKNFYVDLNDDNFFAWHGGRDSLNNSAPIEIYGRLWYYFGNGALGNFRCTSSNSRGKRVCKNICGAEDCYLN